MSKKVTYSEYQKSFFTACTDLLIEDCNLDNILLAAVAGSGKTFSIVECIKFFPRHAKIHFFAFNKSIAEELKVKMPKANVTTIHSYGMRMLQTLGIKLKVDSNKYWSIAEEAIKDCNPEFTTKKEKNRFAYNMLKLYDLFRVNLLELTDDKKLDRDTITQLCLNNGIEESLQLYNVFCVFWVLQKKYNAQMLKKSSTGKEFKIDFTDMIYLPVQFQKSLQFPKNDIVIGDEVQDWSVCQQAIVSLAKGNGKSIMVGDEKQSIYLFAGADAKAWKKLETQEKTVKMPLSVCYRCAKAIVEKARSVYDHILPYEEQIEGEVIEGDSADVFEANAGDFVLCRNTRPLISLWYEFTVLGKKSYIKGDETKKELLKLVESVSEKNIEDGLSHLDYKLQCLHEKVLQQGLEPEKNYSYCNFMEQIECIRILIEKSDDVCNMSDLYSILENVFSGDNSEKICLMTMHKSKGLESDNVYIIRLDLLPSRYAQTEEQLLQEKNLKYVAFTRAKKKLVIDSNFIEK